MMGFAERAGPSVREGRRIALAAALTVACAAGWFAGTEARAQSASVPPTASAEEKPLAPPPKPAVAHPKGAHPAKPSAAGAKATHTKAAAADQVTKPAAPPTQVPVGRDKCAGVLGPAQAKLSGSLLAALAKKSERASVVVSPASLAFALATLERGANADMKQAVRETLGFGTVENGKDEGLDCIRASTAETLKDDAALQRADRLVFSNIKMPTAPLLDKLKADKVDVGHVDLSQPTGIADVNEWTKNATGGLIPSILAQPISQPGLVVLNALRFKAPWQTPFVQALTKGETFTAVDGATSTVPMMSLPSGSYGFATQGRFIGVELPFKEQRFAMSVITTTDAPARADAFAEVASWLDGSRFKPEKGEVQLPQMSVEGSHDLLAALDELGLAAGRRSPGALDGFDKGVAVGSVLQRVSVQANEEGAEAAAATAVIATRSVDDKPLKVKVDKPFMFSIRDVDTGLILVAGYVTHPSGAACTGGESAACANPKP